MNTYEIITRETTWRLHTINAKNQDDAIKKLWTPQDNMAYMEDMEEGWESRPQIKTIIQK